VKIQKFRERLLSALWPQFRRLEPELTTYYTFSNYRRIWLFSIFLLATVSLVPLIVMTAVDHELTRRAVKLEHVSRLVRSASNAEQFVTHFMQERVSALKLTVRELKYEQIANPKELVAVLRNLKLAFGGFVDLGVINDTGEQVAYVGPFDLKGIDYSNEFWFSECQRKGSYVSEVFPGHRNVPHIIVAVKGSSPENLSYILRATLDAERLSNSLSAYGPDEEADIFVINRSGIIQTPSKNFGEVLEKVRLPVPDYSSGPRFLETLDKKNNPLIVAYAHPGEKGSDLPFITLVVKPTIQIMKTWWKLRVNLFFFLLLSIFSILIIIFLTSTFMVNKLYVSDRTKAETMLRLEQTSRLASIGRLAAGVAHEINNPLAVINEEAGYMRDLFSAEKPCEKDVDFTEHLDYILESVERCGQITKQLLGFARHFEVAVQPVKLREVLLDVLSFQKKEAEYRNITVEVDVPETIPQITTDRGKLQQILLNLVNNAFQAMDDGGRLILSGEVNDTGELAIHVSDNGCGISDQNLRKIFEPFFTTKGDKGTGLGLSITYGLVRRLRGKIFVLSKVGEGTTFTINLPIQIQGESNHESPAR
jgi:signal transduction histidine kinase